MNTTTGLHRNPNQKIIAGVCSGLAENMRIDPVIVRLIFVVLAIIVGGGIFIYIVLWIILPVAPFDYQYSVNQDYKQQSEPPADQQAGEPQSDFKAGDYSVKKSNRQLYIGVIFIALGGLLLLPTFFDNIEFADLWPLALIVLGIVLLKPSLK